MGDRHIAGREIDDAAGNEERRYPARAALLQLDRGLRDALDAADAGADEHAAVRSDPRTRADASPASSSACFAAPMA
jgi:hypothetical protein